MRGYTAEQVQQMRQAYAEGVTVRELAAEHGGSPRAAWLAVTNQTYTDVQLQPAAVIASRSRDARKLSAHDAAEVRWRAMRGESRRSIAARFDMAHSAVNKVVARETYRDAPMHSVEVRRVMKEGNH